MVSSSSTFSVLLSLALAFLFVAPSFARHKHHHHHHKDQTALLEDLCSKTINPSLCISFLRSDWRWQNANDRDLTEIAIDLAYNKAKDIHSDLDKLYDTHGNSDPEKEKYHSCSKNYNDAIRDLETTKKLFRDNEYSRIAVQVKDAAQEIKDCRETFDDSSISSTLKTRNKEFEVLIDVVRVFAEYLVKED